MTTNETNVNLLKGNAYLDGLSWATWCTGILRSIISGKPIVSDSWTDDMDPVEINSLIDNGILVSSYNGYVWFADEERGGRLSADQKAIQQANMESVYSAGYKWSSKGNPLGHIIPSPSQSSRISGKPIVRPSQVKTGKASKPSQRPSQVKTGKAAYDALQAKAAANPTTNPTTNPDMAAIIAAVMAAMGQSAPAPAPAPMPKPIVRQPTEGSEHGPVVGMTGPTASDMTGKGAYFKWLAKASQMGMNRAQAKKAWDAAKTAKGATDGVVQREVAPKPQPKPTAPAPVREEDVVILPFNALTLGRWKAAASDNRCDLTYQQVITCTRRDWETGATVTIRMLVDGSNV